MAITQLVKGQEEGEEQQAEVSDECKELLDTLPKERGWRTPHLFLFQGFWCQAKEIQAILSAQSHFQAQATDIVLATVPKSGTTWLKALVFAVVNRRQYGGGSNNHHPLLSHNPHDLVPFLEYKLYADNELPDLSALPSPRLFATHVPVGSLPASVHGSGCQIVYICRNPFDTFVSVWHFLNKLRPQNLGPFSLDEAFDMYCRGVVGFGPYWDHMLGYWKSSRNGSQKVLFMKYEDMKEDGGFELRRMAEFLGCPFTEEEEREGVVEDIARLCSFQTMKELEVNKSGKSIKNIENGSLFRKGEVGDWLNHLTPLMVERLSKVMDEKFGGTGLTFKML